VEEDLPSWVPKFSVNTEFNQMVEPWRSKHDYDAAKDTLLLLYELSTAQPQYLNVKDIYGTLSASQVKGHIRRQKTRYNIIAHWYMLFLSQD
jgi:hypothetical protein